MSFPRSPLPSYCSHLPAKETGKYDPLTHYVAAPYKNSIFVNTKKKGVGERMVDD
jgi:hypothetical protein